MVLRKYVEENGVTRVEIPNTVTYIGRYAFADCKTIRRIKLPKSVTRIGEYAFRGCSSLTSITIPDSVTEIGGGAFYDCKCLKSINIPSSLTKIGAGLFKGFPLENVELPKTLTEVGKEAFYGIKSFRLTSENYTLTLPVPPSRHKTENYSCNEKIPQFIIEKDIDKKWEIVASMKKAPLKHMLSAFMVLAYDSAAAKTYLKRSIKKAMQTFIDMQDVDFVTDVLNLGFVTMKNFDEIFAYLNAKQEGSYTEMKIVFLNYKHDHIGYQTAAERFKL